MPAQKTDPNSQTLLDRVESRLARIATQLSQVRRHIHQHPELSGQEYGTTAYISERLAAGDVAHKIASGERGIITEIVAASEPDAPVVAMRADIDALPIQEESDVPYRSRKPGVMHACGHDAHTAILLGTTLALNCVKPLAVGWRSIFQPSEEIGRGAREMVGHGALDGVSFIIALHVDPNLAVGHVGITPGPRTAFCQDFVIQVRGRGGHGARPHSTVDPIAAAAHLITLIYQAIPRQTDARDPIVVSIGQVNGGHAANVIPDLVTMKGTIRTLAPAIATHGRQILERLCTSVAQAFEANIFPTFEDVLPGLVNDPAIAAHFIATARQMLGSDKVTTNDRPSMGAEDFADYLPLVPGCMVALGAGSSDRKVTPLHTSTFDIDERALLIGARLLARVLLEWPKDRAKRSSNHEKSLC
jgi:amidohydrolase